jgi:carbon-monoxide dehydrogenase medium subunit
MKPAPFEYVAPTTLDEVLELLARHGGEAKLLAGGQSLIPAMNFRLAQPGLLVDLNPVASLAYLRSDNGGLHIGAMTRQRAVERSAQAAELAPLLHATMPLVAHVQIRNRGTIGGSLAHADPAAELPAVAVAAGATLQLRSARGERRVAADAFYIGLFTTDLAEDEMVVEVSMPSLPAHSGWAIDEVARRRGDYALAGAAAQVMLDEIGRCQRARLVFFGVGEGPVYAARAEQALIGEAVTPGLVDEAAALAAAEDVDPVSDIHATAAFRRHLSRVVAKRVLGAAFARAQH